MIEQLWQTWMVRHTEAPTMRRATQSGAGSSVLTRPKVHIVDDFSVEDCRVKFSIPKDVNIKLLQSSFFFTHK